MIINIILTLTITLRLQFIASVLAFFSFKLQIQASVWDSMEIAYLQGIWHCFGGFQNTILHLLVFPVLFLCAISRKNSTF